MSMDVNKMDVTKFKCSNKLVDFSEKLEIYGEWPDDLSGHVFIVAPFHRRKDRHLFAGEGVIIRWDLQSQDGHIKVHSKKLKTWDSFWYSILSPLGKLIPKAFFPARLSIVGVAEIANTAVVNMNGRLILTADAGRYWEVNPETLETITPIGYFDEHIVSIPLSFFPLVANTAHPFYDPHTKELLTCELKSKPRQENLFTDMLSAVYITSWDGKGTLKHWELDGTVLDGSPHTAIVTKELVMIPDMPFQMGVSMILGLKIPPRKAYPKTQIYVVRRKDLETAQENKDDTVPSRLVTFEGDSYHFLCNYHHIDGKINFVAVQQATLSLTEAIQPDDVKHFSGESYKKKYYGIPWMFAFDPGVLRKVTIKDAELISEEAFIHPGWYSTMLYTADPRELWDEKGYSAIYQVYAGYHRDLICRRQYLSFRDSKSRILTQHELFQDWKLPQQDLPSVVAKVPLDEDWEKLTKDILKEKAENPDTPLSELGKEQEALDFYVCPQEYILDSIQFIPQDKGYLFTTVLSSEGSEVWLFAADCLKRGPIAKLRLSTKVDLGFTLHSEYFENISARESNYNVNRLLSAVRSLTKVPYEFLFNRRDDIVNRKVN